MSAKRGRHFGHKQMRTGSGQHLMSNKDLANALRKHGMLPGNAESSYEFKKFQPAGDGEGSDLLCPKETTN
jgi:hypothetical protein